MEKNFKCGHRKVPSNIRREGHATYCRTCRNAYHRARRARILKGYKLAVAHGLID